MIKKHKLIIILDRQKLTIAGTKLATPVIFEYPSSAIFDMDVVDYDSLKSSLQLFLDQHKIAPADSLLVVSPQVYYDKQISFTSSADQDKQIEDFKNTIPYKNLLSKVYSRKGEHKLVCINKNLYEPLIHFFEKSRFDILLILPHFSLEMFNLKLTEYTSKEVNLIYQKIKSLEPLSLITGKEIDKSVSLSTKVVKEDKTRTIILLAVFSLLFIGLLALLLLRPYFAQKNQSKAIITQKLTSPTIIPSPTIMPTPTITVTPIKELKVKIINSSGINNQAGKIKQMLSNLGFASIETSSSPKVSGQKNQIIYSPYVSEEDKQKIRLTIKASAGIFSEQQSVSLEGFDIIITTVLINSN